MCLKLCFRVGGHHWDDVCVVSSTCRKHQITQEFSKEDLDKWNGQNSIEIIAEDELGGERWLRNRYLSTEQLSQLQNFPSPCIADGIVWIGIRVSLLSTALPDFGHRDPREGLTSAEG